MAKLVNKLHFHYNNLNDKIISTYLGTHIQDKLKRYSIFGLLYKIHSNYQHRLVNGLNFNSLKITVARCIENSENLISTDIRLGALFIKALLKLHFQGLLAFPIQQSNQISSGRMY